MYPGQDSAGGGCTQGRVAGQVVYTQEASGKPDSWLFRVIPGLLDTLCKRTRNPSFAQFWSFWSFWTRVIPLTGKEREHPEHPESPLLPPLPVSSDSNGGELVSEQGYPSAIQSFIRSCRSRAS